MPYALKISLHFVPKGDKLRPDGGEGFIEKPGPVIDKGHPVNEVFHPAGDLKRITWTSKNNTVRLFQFCDKRITIIVMRAKFLSFIKA